MGQHEVHHGGEAGASYLGYLQEEVSLRVLPGQRQIR